MTTRETIREPARSVPVRTKCDVLVLGAGPAGCAAAASAAQAGADVLLVERYGHLGGMSTGGLVIIIPSMTDWTGKHVMKGFASDLLGRLPKEGILGPPPEAWGSRDPALLKQWAGLPGGRRDMLRWAPTVDPEHLKLVSIDLLADRHVRLLLHAWAVAPIQEGNAVKGVIIESKSGREAVLAKVVVDATGDGDIFAQAGAAFEGDIQSGDIHSSVNTAFRFGGVDMDRYNRFQQEHKEEFEAIMARGVEQGVRDHPSREPRNDVCVFMGPRLYGYDCTNVEDLTKAEIESRRLMLGVHDFYKKNVPGFENAWIMQTAPQLGTRHSRRLLGVKRVERPEWVAGKVHEDEIGVTPAPNPQHPNVSLPLGCMVPADVDNILAAGRNLSCDAPTHTFARLIAQCWVLGQGAGVAAAVAVNAGVTPRNVDIREVQRQLLKQGAYLQGQPAAVPVPEPPRRQ